METITKIIGRTEDGKFPIAVVVTFFLNYPFRDYWDNATEGEATWRVQNIEFTSPVRYLTKDQFAAIDEVVSSKDGVIVPVTKKEWEAAYYG